MTEWICHGDITLSESSSIGKSILYFATGPRMDENTFMELKKTLTDDKKSFVDKIEALLVGWKSIYTLMTKNSRQSFEHYMKFLNKNTLQYLLHGDWTQLEDSFRVKFTVVLHKLMALFKTDQDSLKKLKILIKLIHEPWNNSTLHKILHSLSPTDNEVREYISTEGSELLLMRLEVLCEGKCEDLALKLASAILKHLKEHKDFKKQDVDYIGDVSLMLLFKFKKNQEIIEQLKNLNLNEGLDLIKRFGTRKSNDTGLWKFCDKVTEIAAHTVLASVIVQNVESKEKQSLFYELVNEWALIHVPKLDKCLSTLCNMVRKIVQKAESPIHVYIFAQVLHKQLGDQAKPLCIELYIRGFTSNINLIEHFKSSNDSDKTLKAEVLLSNSFLELSELLEDNIIIHRECILTSFSLHPTKECLERLENAACLRCKNCKNEEISQKIDSDKSDTLNNCDNVSCVHAREKVEDNFIDAVNSLNILNSDLLGLAPHLCDDLSTVLCSPRCQSLSWSLGWARLKKLCEKYLDDYCEQKTRSTELKYLNIDYTQFGNKQNIPKTETKNDNNSQKKIKKPKPNKEVPSLNVNVSPENASPENTSPVKKVPLRNYVNTHKREIDKKLWNYSMMKTSHLVQRNYNLSSLAGESNNKTGILCNVLSSNRDKDKNALRFFSEPYTLNSKNGSIPYYDSNESSVLSCSNSSYDDVSAQSPKPAEVPPVTLTEVPFHDRFAPLLESVPLGNTKAQVTEIISKGTKHSSPMEYKGKSDLGERFRRANILSKSHIKNDKLLAKCIPGMNSLDLIVPLRPEPTVQVVQIPSSNAVLQPVSSNSPATIQTNSTTISIAKPLTEPISTQSTDIVTTHSHTQHSQAVESNHETPNNSNLLLTTVVNQGGLARIHNSDQRSASLLSSSVALSRTQNKSSESNSSDNISISSDTINSLVNINTHEGSTQVTAHIQRIGQPHKQKLIFDDTNSSKSTSSQNSNVHIPGTIQIYEDPSKHPQSSSVSGSVYRFILKDGKILEQYYQANQNSAFPLPEVLNDGNLQSAIQQENVIKVFKKKKDLKKDESSNTENVQVPSLPQFHQAFRRQVYQSGSIIEGNTLPTSPPNRQYSEESVESQKPECVSSPLSKAVQTVLKDAETSTKSSEKLTDESLSVTPSQEMKEDLHASDVQSQSGVIFTCKVPITLSGNSVLQAKPVTILKSTNNPHEVLGRSSQKHENEVKSKDSVIRSNMNALLAAALQNTPVKTNTIETSNSNIVHCLKQGKVIQDIKNDNSNKLRMSSPPHKNVRRQTLVQQPNVSRFARAGNQSSPSNTSNQNVATVATIPLPTRTVQVLSTNVNQNTISNMSKVDTRRETLQQNSEPSSVSSTTLEQLREFESVLEQVTNTSQMKERGNAKKTETLVPCTSSNSDFSSSSPPKVNALFQTSLVGAISDMNNERVSLTFISKASTTCTNTLISGASPKITATTPVVVVQSCNRPLASPALSITSQNSPGSSPSTPPASSQSKMNPKLSKPKAKSIGGKTAPTQTLKVSTIPKPQQKPQEDEQTTQRIYAILDKYAEQLRNSPELKNKPAPRRRSNPPTNPSQSSKRKKSSQSKSKSFSSIPSCSGMEMSPNSEDLRTGGSEDSSNGVSQVTQTVNSPHSRSEEHSNQGDTSSDIGEPPEKEQRLQHRILLADQSGGSGRTVIVQDNVQPVISVEGTKVIAGKQLVVGGNATVPLTLQLPGSGNVKQVLFPVPTDGRPFVVAKVPKMYRFHQVTMPSGSPLIATNTSGTVLLRQMCLNKSSSTLKQVKLPVVSQISTHMASHPTVVLPSGSPSTFTLATGSSLDSESLGITLDNTILLNSSTQASSIGFIQRNVTKSTHSPNVNQTRQMSSQETNTSSSSSEILSPIKTESTIIKSEGETSRNSETSDVEIKSEDVKFSVETNTALNETSHKGVNIITSSNSNWAQVLKDNAGSTILHKIQDEEEKHSQRKDSADKGICMREVGKAGESGNTVQQSSLPQNQGLKRKVENTIFQIAFKRDKMKISKDDFIQQRNTFAIERELRLQKSLSEECEDLGVDKPSTSDLFPEAELLLDPDPLSRDSLQGETFPRGDSSSNSSSSPNGSPIFSSKCPGASWKKHKQAVMRHKFSYSRSLSPSKKGSEKIDCSRDSSNFNVNLNQAKNIQDSNNTFKCISKEPVSINDSELQESDITMECNDSDPCNFSDVDENNDTDMLDTEGDSDNDFMQKSRHLKQSSNLPVKKEAESDKASELSLLRKISSNTFNKSEYCANKESQERKHSDSSPWFQMIKGIQKETIDSENDRINQGCNDDISESQNGVLEDFDEHHDEGADTFGSNKSLLPRKRKKVGLFMTSQSEDSSSSIDTLLSSEMCSSDFHDSIEKRESSRGRVKKGCPCFNGSPEPNKKKKDAAFLDKTDKPCSTKTSFTFVNKKTVSKSDAKFINRKR